ncbi:MAG: glycosyltransferase [Chlorobi bacterium]|nr:glycosyltransferase [Chlorobiota bacterium]
MKIAYLSTFYPFRGGIAHFNASVFNEFNKEHEIKAFTFKRQYPNILFPGKTQYVTKEDKVEKIPSVELLDTINPISYFKTIRKINRYNPDILIMKYWMSFFGPSLGTVSKFMKKNTKSIAVLDNVIPHEKRFFDKAFTTYFLRNVDGFIVMSETVKNDLLTLKPHAKYIQKQHPLYNHFGNKKDQNDAKKELGLDLSKKIVLFFGIIRDYKGLDLLLKSVKMLPDDYQVVIAGESYGSFDKYLEIIDNEKIKNKIILKNEYISDNEVSTYFSAADVCILPYKSATQSGITYISYHFDLPIIATNVGGLKETIKHEQTGIIVERPDVEMIGNAIIQYFEQDKKSFFIKNIKALKEELSWENFAKEILNLYQQL